MIYRLKAWIKSRMTPDQVAALRISLARLGRRKGAALEELWLHRLARAGDIATFVQIGANDGNEADPMASIIRRHKLKGVMVEPIPYFFDKLKRRYSDRHDIRFVNAAIAETNGERPFFYLPPDDPALPAWANGLGSFNRETIMSHTALIENLDTIIRETTVPCITLNALLEQCKLREFDVLLIDTEGYDYRIIQQIDFDRFQPKVILFEHLHIPPDEQGRCRSLLLTKR